MTLWKGKKEKAIGYAGAVLVLGIVLMAFLFMGGGEMIGLDFGNGNGSFSLPWDDPGGAVEGTFGSYGNFMLIILIGAIAVLLSMQKVKPLLDRLREGEEKEEDLEDQVSHAVDRAITQLKEGKDVKSSILRCYQQMCIILEKKGVEYYDFMTPREFEKYAINKLDITESKVLEIRELFELAQYSTHSLGDKERDRAVNSLEELRKELE